MKEVIQEEMWIKTEKKREMLEDHINVNNKVYKIGVQDWEEPILGIMIENGKDWVLFSNLNDYLVDGFGFVSKEYITYLERKEREMFTERVLKTNNRLNHNKINPIPLSTKSLLKYFLDNDFIFQVSFNDDSYTYIGKIDKLISDAFYLKKIDSRGVWLEETQLIKLNSIIKIEINTDYINCLLAYSKTL